MRFPFILALLLYGCSGKPVIKCEVNADCLQGGITGTCLPSPQSTDQYCAFPDPGCDSGNRWGVAAGDGLAEDCVDEASAIDASPPSGDAAGAIDGGGTDATPTTIIAMAAGYEDRLLFVNAGTLANDGDLVLPARDSGVYQNTGLFLDGPYVWITSLNTVMAIDPGTLSTISGFPVNSGTIGCDSFFFGSADFAGERMFCATDTGITALSGVPFAFVDSVILPSVTEVAASEHFVVLRYGTGPGFIGVLDASLDPVAGSPVQGAPVGGGGLEISEEMELIYIGTQGNAAAFYDSVTLTSVGELTLAGGVATVAFDVERNRIIIITGDGRVGAYDGSNLSVLVPPLQRATSIPEHAFVDRSRQRLYVLGGIELVVLDLVTLQHVAGSPVTLPTDGVRVTAF